MKFYKEDALIAYLLIKWLSLYFFMGRKFGDLVNNIDCLEKIQLRFCKLLLKLKSSTPNYMIYVELGRFPIEIDIKIRMVSFWVRLLLGKETKLSYFKYHVNFYTLFLLKKMFTSSGLNI